MPGFFSTCLGAIRAETGSTATNRKANRVNLGAQVIATSTSYMEPGLMIPMKLAQGIISLIMLFHASTNSAEKLLHFLLTVTALAQMGFASPLIFNHLTCDSDSTDWLCDSGFYLQLVYAGLLVVNTALAEGNKATTNTDANANANADVEAAPAAAAV